VSYVRDELVQDEKAIDQNLRRGLGYLQGAPVKNNPLEKKLCISAKVAQILAPRKLSEFVFEYSRNGPAKICYDLLRISLGKIDYLRNCNRFLQDRCVNTQIQILKVFCLKSVLP